jgi:hypothetical protein
MNLDYKFWIAYYNLQSTLIVLSIVSDMPFFISMSDKAKLESLIEQRRFEQNLKLSSKC